MDMQARNQYLTGLRERYFAARRRREKTAILEEYCRNTGQNRKYVIRKLHSQPGLQLRPRKKGAAVYDGPVKAALVRCWEIFDHACGQRLAPLLKTEVDRLKGFGELGVSTEVAGKLKRISPATIDRLLGPSRAQLKFSRTRRLPRPGSRLYRHIPVRLTSWDTARVGFVEMDLVAHGGGSSADSFLYSLSVTEIATGWWEGQAVMGRGQQGVFEALKQIRRRCPFRWRGIDCDNDSAFINDELYRYCRRERLPFTRSRPGHKNDNAYIEQKNYTHVRQVFGYQRYDTAEELALMNRLYEGELRQFKNFFSPVMKLASKERVGGRVKRRYDVPKTPCDRLLASGALTREHCQRLQESHRRLNPAELHRRIEEGLGRLERVHNEKRRRQKSGARANSEGDRSVTF